MNMRGLSDLNGGSGGGGGSSSGGGGGGNGCSDCIKQAWANTPLWTRCLLIVSTAIYGISWLSEYILYIFFCSPPLIIYKLQVWRLFTGHFVHPQLLTLLFALLSHAPHAANAERTIGTVRYFFRFWLLGTMTLLMFTATCGIAQLPQFSLGLWPMFFCDLVIECMATAEQTTNLCCLPIQIKRKWYPLILIAIFSLMFFQLSMWFGLAVGYMYHYGFFSRIEMGSERATRLEGKFPFSRYQEQQYFVTAGGAMGGEILPSFMNRNSSAQESAAAESRSGTAAAAGTGSAAASFKAFSGKGRSLGGDPVQAPRFDSQGASASRGRSTPATRAASSASSTSSTSAGSAPVSSAPGARAGAALIAKLEQKKKEEAESSSALTTTDVGHDMAPAAEAEVLADPEGKESAAYGKVNLNDTESSV